MELVAPEPQVTEPGRRRLRRGRPALRRRDARLPRPAQARARSRSAASGSLGTATATASTRPPPSSPTSCPGRPASPAGTAGCSSPRPPDIWYCKDTNGDGMADVRKKVVHRVRRLQRAGPGERPPVGPRQPDLRRDGRQRRRGPPGRQAGRRSPCPSAAATSGSTRGPAPSRRSPATAQFGNAFDDWYNRFLCAQPHSSPGTSSCRARPGPQPGPGRPRRSSRTARPRGRTSRCRCSRSARPSPGGSSGPSSTTPRGRSCPPSEMVATGFFTSGSGVTIYRGDAYPAKYRGQAFLGERRPATSSTAGP